jgi:dsRNA-specific ribonuclease
MEAIIGAIFPKKGYKVSKQYVLKILQHLPIDSERGAPRKLSNGG